MCSEQSEGTASFQNACLLACVLARLHACLLACIRARLLACMLACMHACLLALNSFQGTTSTRPVTAASDSHSMVKVGGALARVSLGRVGATRGLA